MCSKACVSGILLAGGKSSRMGSNKAELLFRGMPLAGWQVQKMRSVGISEILISGYGPGMIPDDIPEKGPLGGLYSCLRRASNRCCLVLPVDVPLIPEETLIALIQAHKGGITLLECNGKIEPLIGIYDSGLAETILPMLQSGSTAVRRLLDSVGYRTIPFTEKADLLTNCNTPEEFASCIRTE